MSLLLALTLGAGALQGSPLNVGGPIKQSVAVGQIEGGLAIVALAGETVVAFRGDGSVLRGFPWSMGSGETASGPPAIGDIDGDGRNAIAVTTGSGKLWLWSAGAVLKGFPAQLGAATRASPSFADVDGDRRPEVLVGDEKGNLHAFKKNGREAKGWPKSIGAAVTSPVSSSRFAGSLSLAVGCEDGRVHVLDAAGRERPGFPLTTAFTVTGPPAFADVDDDGVLDLVAASQDFKVHVVNEKGRPLAGFPVGAGYRIYGGAAVGDLDGDGKLDLVFASADGQVHAVNGSGGRLPGYPVKVGTRLFGGPALGDLDRDGKLDVAVATADGQIAALSRTGEQLPGFPARSESNDLSASVVMTDIDGDAGPSIIVGLPSGVLERVRAARRGNAPSFVPWQGPGRDAARTGRFGPNPPTYRDLLLVPAAPRVSDRLRASWRTVSIDVAPGDPQPVAQIEWLRNDQPVQALRGKTETPAGAARKGEHWRFVLTPPGGTRAFRSEPVTIADSPPGTPTVKIEPATPSRIQPARVLVTKPASDPDGDVVQYRFEWLIDGAATGVTGDTFPSQKTKRGSALMVRATANDGEMEGEPTVAEARMVNTGPGSPRVAMTPKTPKRMEVLSVQLVEPAPDLDGDRLEYRYSWKVDGQAKNFPGGAPALSAGALRKHQKATVEVRAFDGELEGPVALADAVATNTPPEPPQVRIVPQEPLKGDVLTAEIVVAAPDADGDALSYRYAWTKNGKSFSPGGDPSVVQAKDLERGDRFEVAVWANDGEQDGGKAGAAVTVGNRPPSMARVAIEPEFPRGGDTLRMVLVRASQDADGDQVRYQVAWTRDGKPTGGDSSTLPPASFKKHEKVRVTVTPSDGRVSGTSSSAECIPANSLPGTPEIAIEPAEPSTGTGMKVLVRRPSVDRDGDEVSYRYRWTRDSLPAGVEQSAVAPGVAHHGEVWRVAVTPFDGEQEGEPSAASVTIRNTQPPAPQVVIRPESPVAGTVVSCQLRAPERDADQEPLEHRARWFRNGERVALVEGRLEVPAGVVRRGEKWRCEGWTFDGVAESAHASAEVVVKNSPPSAPKVVIEPEQARAGDELVCRIAQDGVDPDEDRINYQYNWWKGDSSTSADQFRVRSGRVRKGERWRCAATPDDGTAKGTPGSAERVIGNSPPGPARARIMPAIPTAGEPLRCQVTDKATDPDGDPVRYRYSWVRNGEAQPFAETTDELPARIIAVGEKWLCRVIPSDGDLSGPMCGSAEVTIGPTRTGAKQRVGTEGSEYFVLGRRVDSGRSSLYDH